MKQIIAPASFSDELEVLRKLDLTNCIVNRPAIDLAREQRRCHRASSLPTAASQEIAKNQYSIGIRNNGYLVETKNYVADFIPNK